MRSAMNSIELGNDCMTYERTNLSRLTQLEFFGLKFMILLKRTWATGAIPLNTSSATRFYYADSVETHIGAPG